MNCPVHISACDCREHKVAVLIKASLDAAEELDWIKNVRGVTTEQRESCKQLVERLYAANKALVVEIGAEDEDSDHQRGCVCATCMPAFAYVAGKFTEGRS